MQPHDYINKDYYITTLPTNISIFVKIVVKETLAQIFVEEIAVENDLRSIGVIIDQGDSKDSKENRKKPQGSSDKTIWDIEEKFRLI